VPRNRSSSAVLDSTVSRPRPQPFPSRSRSALRRRAVVGVLVLLSLVLITISFREPTSGALHGVQSAGATVLRPFEVGAERLARPFQDVYGYFRGLVHAKDENKDLRAQLDRARQELIQQQSATKDNIRFRALLKYIDSPRFPVDYSPVVARIISQPESEFSQQVVISAGSDAGIRQDTPVVTDDGLVGRVTDLNGGAAQVTLITDDESAVQARDQKTNAIGLVRIGQGQGQLILDRVAKDQDVQVGDVIVTAGTRSKQYPSLFPRGIPIGQVVSVGQTDTAPYKSIQIQSYVNFGSLDSVIALVTKKKTPVAP
jgi:rod shape-determining protein MreC